MSTLRLVLLRHGRSRADDEGVHEGSYDSPLTGVGRDQARRRAAEWREGGVTFDRVVASPLKRARETAEIVADVLGLTVETADEWRERDNGLLAALPFDEAEKRYPRPAFVHPFLPHGVTGESEWEVTSRAAAGLSDLVRGGAGSTLVVAHGGILNAAMRVVTGATTGPRDQGVAFAFGDLGYAEVRYRPDKHLWTLAAFSRGV